jgi:hypothetical protein
MFRHVLNEKLTKIYLLCLHHVCMKSRTAEWIFTKFGIRGRCHHGMALPEVADAGEGLPIWRVLFFFSRGVRLSPFGTTATTGLL